MTKSKPQLTPERVREVWEYNSQTGHLTWRIKVGRSTRIGRQAGRLDQCGYRIVTLGGRMYSAARLAYAHHHGKWPRGKLVHINGDGDDNRIENLRFQKDQREITLELVQELLAYEETTGVLRWLKSRSNVVKVGDIAGKKNDAGYLVVRLNKKHYRAHRIAWLLTYGEWPASGIDHVNGDRSDNRIENLRLATAAQNGMNSRRPSGNTSGHKGVCYYKARDSWISYITANGKRHHLGYFKSKRAAIEAYSDAAKRLHGQFARIE